ncbi:hypothetical protein C8R48DRAFT_599803 [Suillus tomentosus]|nr:hypothetical protein C8R48DRAFT_599803 [Suillus tomentosus]
MPRFYRGDLLFLTNPPGQRYHTGDITVYRIPGAEIPIVHRVLETRDVFIPFDYGEPHPKLKLPPGEHQLMLTKGDNNHVDDIDLYRGLEWLDRRHIIGKVRGYVFFTFFLPVLRHNLRSLIRLFSMVDVWLQFDFPRCRTDFQCPIAVWFQ